MPNGLLGYMADAVDQSVNWMKDPRRTQQLQMLGGLLSSGSDALLSSAQKNRELTAKAFGNPDRPLQVTDKQALNNLTEQTMSGPMGFAQAGMFIGSGSKIWDKAMANTAEQMEKAGIDARKIWSETGTWRGPDGKLRQEIPDNTAQFRGDFNSTAPNKVNDYKGGQEGPVGGMYSHPELYKAYPEILTNDRMSLYKQPDWFPNEAKSGTYSKGIFNQKGKIDVMAQNEQDALSIAAHELQHSVQSKEGFASGGTAKNFYNESLKRLMQENEGSQMTSRRMDSLKNMAEKEAYEKYRSLMGEAEARATQERLPLTQEQRRWIFPEDSYDMPIKGLLQK
jgi:hypothetical protein